MPEMLGSTVSNSPEVSNKTYPDSLRLEMGCTAVGLTKHIIGKHLLSPAILAGYGVAKYDIEIACVRMFSLSEVVLAAYQILEESDDELRARVEKERTIYLGLCRSYETAFQKLGLDYRDLNAHKTIIIKNLKYIEQLGLAEINWRRVIGAVPDGLSITLDLDRDTTDVSFFTKRATFGLSIPTSNPTLQVV